MFNTLGLEILIAFPTISISCSRTGAPECKSELGAPCPDTTGDVACSCDTVLGTIPCQTTVDMRSPSCWWILEGHVGQEHS